jgi:putative spermidine/putrescine transport system ATP-binding protein/spermidine/putrescine transport system ATP-binding protein
MTNAVELSQITRRFGNAVVAVDNIDLNVPEGAFVTLLGPSGCGKTTTLRMIAGLETPDAGEVRIKGRRVNEVAIHKRNLGIVFQNYALFPHKSIFDNVAFGLKYRSVPKEEIRKRVTAALDIVRLPGVEARFPSQLSGGQQQRIALARALVIEPDVLLLDEPLSALDANLREEMRVELKNIQRRVGVATVFVTHDQGEALAMSDLVVVMNKGRIEQMGAPAEVYEQPQSEFVANFLGNANFLTATVAGEDAGGIQARLADGALLKVARGATRPVHAGDMVKVVVRAEKVVLTAPQAAALTARIVDVDYLGALARYELELAGGQRLRALSSLHEKVRDLGQSVGIAIDPEHCRIL